ncbi:MAG TPA: ParA family protein [Candidatus Enterenecus stercoripullorum]|nr:ParA family protein [Candidatus Enterenecus stercoripullorum]
MRTFAILNMKGGVGKTTTAINLAYILATAYQQRVLLVDADGQANATRALLPAGEYDGLTALLSGHVICYDEVVEHTEISGLDMVPASNSLWQIDLSCITRDGPGTLRALRDMRDAITEDIAYDVMIIDCPPSFSGACAAAIAASNSIIIPVLPDAFSAEGMEDLVAQIDGVRRIQPDVRIAGCLINQFHTADVVLDATEYLRESAPVPVFDTVIHRTDKVLESTWAHQPVLLWSPRSSAARDFRSWVRELVAKEALCNGR